MLRVLQAIHLAARSIRPLVVLAVLLLACHDDGDASDTSGDTGGPVCTNCESSCEGDICSATCPADEDCNVMCPADHTCEVGCTAGNTCDVTCDGPVSCEPIDCTSINNCEITCSNGASCFIDCADGNNCDVVTCTTGASCTMNCVGANNCSFSQCDHPDGEVDCGDGLKTCNAACPQ